MITQPHHDGLRIIAKMLAKEIDSPHIQRVFRHRNTHGNIGPGVQAQIVKRHVADAHIVQIASLIRDAPRLKKAELRR